MAAPRALSGERPLQDFAIQAQDLGAAIIEMQHTYGVNIKALQVFFEGKRAHAVVGRMTLEQAMHRLLEGTGLTAVFEADGSVVLIKDEEGGGASASPKGVSSDSSTVVLEDIIVTAQRRPQDLQRVPLSVLVVEGDRLSSESIDSYHALSQLVPVFTDAQNSRGGNRYIRGVGSGESQTFEQSVGVYLDDIYLGRTRGDDSSLLDLDRVEILRGPQTTLFGANSIAGALSLTSRMPGNAHEGSVRAFYGTHGQYVLEAAESGPLTGSLSGRLAVKADGTQGWLDNIATGHTVPARNDLAVRGTLLWQPVDAFDASLKVEGSRNRTNGALALQDTGCPPPPPFTASGFCNVALATGTPIGLTTREIAQNDGQSLRLTSGQSVLTVHARFGGHTLTSVTGVYHYDYGSNIDTDGTPQQLLNIAAPEHYTQVSHEVRLASPTGQPIQYLFGTYIHADRLSYLHDAGYFFLTPTLSSVPSLAALVPYLPLGQRLSFAQNEQTYSTFGSFTWQLTPALSWSAGLRGSWVRKSWDWSLYYGTASQAYGGIVPFPAAVDPLARAFAQSAGLGTAGSLSGNRDDHGLMPSTQLQYRLWQDAMAYFSFSRGWKAGGANGNDLTAQAGNLPFYPEHVNAYELGWKSEWFERSLRLNIDAFRSDYTDLQVASNIASAGGGFQSLVRNAASSRTQGFELSTDWVISGLRLSSSVTYDESKYLSYPNVAPTQLQGVEGITLQDLSGRPTEFAPKWSGSLGASYTWAVGPGSHLTAGATGVGSTSYFLTGNDDPTIAQGSYVRLDARLTLAGAYDRWALDLIGRNLTDRVVATFGVNWPTATGGSWFQTQERRAGGLQARYNW